MSEKISDQYGITFTRQKEVRTKPVILSTKKKRMAWDKNRHC
jgi:hypothetical protein